MGEQDNSHTAQQIIMIRHLLLLVVVVLALASVEAGGGCGLKQEVKCDELDNHIANKTFPEDVDLVCEHNSFWCWFCMYRNDEGNKRKYKYLEYCRSGDHKFPGSDRWMADWEAGIPTKFGSG